MSIDGICRRQLQLQWGLQTSAITANTTVLPPVIISEKAKCQVGVSEDKDVSLFPQSQGPFRVLSIILSAGRHSKLETLVLKRVFVVVVVFVSFFFILGIY